VKWAREEKTKQWAWPVAGNAAGPKPLAGRRCYLSRMPRDIDVMGVWHGKA